MSADALHELREFARGCSNGAAGHDGASRAPATRRVRRVLRVAVNELDARDVDAQDFVRDLWKRGLHALTMRVRTDTKLETAVRGHAGGRLFMSRHHGNTPARV